MAKDITVNVDSRRSFLVKTAGVAAAGAVALAASPAIAMGDAPGKTSPELRAAYYELQAADDALKVAYNAWRVIWDKARTWEKRNPQPATMARRVYRKWEARHDKYMDEIGWSQDHFDAKAATENRFVAAQIAFAKIAPRNMYELTLKAGISTAFEDPNKRHFRRLHPIIAQSVAWDACVMAGWTTRSAA